jgi:hypothetical protein
MNLPIPRALYSCKECADEFSWPATDLHWCKRVKGWICINCWDHHEHGTIGIRLSDEIARQAREVK